MQVDVYAGMAAARLRSRFSAAAALSSPFAFAEKTPPPPHEEMAAFVMPSPLAGDIPLARHVDAADAAARQYAGADAISRRAYFRAAAAR